MWGIFLTHAAKPLQIVRDIYSLLSFRISITTSKLLVTTSDLKREHAESHIGS